MVSNRLDDVTFAEIVIRRSHCLVDMIQAFKEPSLVTASHISCRRLLDSGQSHELEVAEGDGVLRDCLTSFWDEWYLQASAGTDCKVPSLQPNFGQVEWSSIGENLIHWI